MWASVPTRLQIPSISVDSGLSPLGLQADGTMEVPASGFPAGYYTGAPTPGELGPAIIAGHIDWNGPAVFFLLHTVAVGAEVDVTREDGSVAVFEVTEVGEYPKDAFPTALVYGDLDYAGLRLITCGGAFDKATGHYEVNVVVFAKLVRSTPPTV
jgi:sortase (surface protein transpeptidase)